MKKEEGKEKIEERMIYFESRALDEEETGFILFQSMKKKTGLSE